MSGGRWPEAGATAQEIIKDLDSLFLALPSLVYGFHSLGGKTVNEPPGMACGPQTGRKELDKRQGTHPLSQTI